MNYLHELVPLLAPLVPLVIALIWPLTALIILFWFKAGIRDLIKSVAEAKIGDSLVFKFWQAKSDLSSIETLPITASITHASATYQPSGAPSEAKWDRVANLFWLGNDLDSTAQIVLRAAPKEKIVHGLTQSYHHASECGLSDTVPGKHLAALKLQVQYMQESALDRDWRANFVEQLYLVIKEFSEVAIEHQRNFRPSPPG
jgi:hypothetical protein